MANGSYKAIRPYYYNLGREYGLDKNAIDNLVKYDEKSGQVSFGGKNLGSPVVEANGTSYWDENKLKNEWNNYITSNGLSKVGAKSQNNNTVTEGFRPYTDVSGIYKEKQNWANAAAKGDAAGQNKAANAALKYYNSLRENGYGSVADELEAADGSDDFAKKYYGTVGLVPFRDYLYQKGASDGFSKADIDKLIAYNDVTGEVSFNGKNLGKPMSEINGTSYWQQGDLDDLYTNYINNGGGALMSPKAKYNKFIDTSYRETTENRNNSEAEEKQLRDYYNTLVNQVLGGLDGVDVAKNASESKDYQNAFKATMAKYDLAALQGRDNAAASAAASNGGNIDSYAAANAMRQQAALTAEGLAAASKMGLDAYNASLNAYNSRLDRVKGILSDLGVRNDNAVNNRRAYTQDRNNLAQMVFDNDQTAQNNDVDRKRSISEVTGYVPREWAERDNPFLKEDGTVKDEYMTKEFDDNGGFAAMIANTSDEVTKQYLREARTKKMLGNMGKYGQYMSDGDIVIRPREETADIDQANKDRQSAQDIAFNQTATELQMNENDNATDLSIAQMEAELAELQAKIDAAKNGGGKTGSGSSSSGSGITQSNASKNLLLWIDWANGDEVEKEFKWSSNGALTYNGSDDFNHKSELLAAAQRDNSLSQSEKDAIAAAMKSKAVSQSASEINKSTSETNTLTSETNKSKLVSQLVSKKNTSIGKSGAVILSEFFRDKNISAADANDIAKQAGFSENEIAEYYSSPYK